MDKAYLMSQDVLRHRSQQYFVRVERQSEVLLNEKKKNKKSKKGETTCRSVM